MKARDIVGKRVVAVSQVRRSAGRSRPPFVDLRHLEFEDGTRLAFHVVETDWDYGVQGLVVKPRGGQA
jgi:hypothetical protein